MPSAYTIPARFPSASACPNLRDGSARPELTELPEGSERDASEILRLQAEVTRLQNGNRDRQAALSASKDHGRFLQEHVNRLSASLAAEIQERQAVEDKLQKLLKLLDSITREKTDLEVIVQILTDQGDIFAAEGEKARIDALTQISNRRGFDEYLCKQWGRHAQTQQPLSLLIYDVDHFKLYNDHYGHQAGDECLKIVAGCIERCLRAGDVVARYGGEEFAVVLPHTHLEGALKLGERVRAALDAASVPHAASPVSGQVTVSVGVACMTPSAADAEAETIDAFALVEEADRNLYLAKRHGRNRVYREAKEHMIPA